MRPDPQPGILNIKPYIGGNSSIPGVQKIIKLASNENALGASEKAKQAYINAAEKLFRYPDGSSEALRVAIASHHNLDANRIICGAGSDEILAFIMQAFVGVGDEIIYSQYGFLMYPIGAYSVGATPIAAQEDHYHTSVDNILNTVTSKTKAVFIANPNNPTGTYIGKDEILRLRKGLRDDIILVLDAAYAEYIEQDDYTAGADIVDMGENTIMTRTFSKIYGLPSLRLGWGYFPEYLADIINRIRGPFNVSMPAQYAGIAALDDMEFTKKSKIHNDIWMEILSKKITEMGYEIIPSYCNFLLVKFPDAEKMDAHLQKNGIIVRNMKSYNLPEFLRITIGNEEENKKLLQVLGVF